MTEDALAQRGLIILIANIVMSGRSGTEAVTRMVAEGLLRRGHRPMVYTSSLGPLSDQLHAMSIPVVTDISRLQARPDIIHGHHNALTAAAIARFPDVPALFVCYDFRAWHSGPPDLPQVTHFAADSGAKRDRLIVEHGVDPDRVTLLLNAIDTARFRPARALPAKPRRVVAFTNYDAHLAAINAACEARHLPLEVIGAHGKPTAQPEAVLPDCDLVFASALGAMEAMACGAAVILCDGRGLAGRITPETFPAWRQENFELRTLRRQVTAVAIGEEIDAYDAEEAARVSDRLRQEAGLEPYLDQICRLHAKVIAEYEAPTPLESAIALSRHVAHWGPHEPQAALLAAERLRVMEQILDLKSGIALLQPGETHRIASDTAASWVAVYGFSQPERWGIWSVGREAVLLLNARLSGETVLSWMVRGFVTEKHPTLHCDVLVNGQPAGHWTFAYPEGGSRGSVRTARFYAKAGDRNAVAVRFALSEVVSPRDLGISGDDRTLGIGLEALTIESP